MATQQRSGQKRSKTSSLTQQRLILPIFLVLFGLGLVILASSQNLGWPWHRQKAAETVQIPSKPAKLYVPRLARVLAVSDGQVVDNRWTISQTGVSYLVGSAIPGEQGNSVIYGHNRKNILGGLPVLKQGDTIYVVLQNGNFAKYHVSQTMEIKPTQVEILAPSPDSRLTIYTCSGFLDQARFVVVANLDGAS